MYWILQCTTQTTPSGLRHPFSCQKHLLLKIFSWALPRNCLWVKGVVLPKITSWTHGQPTVTLQYDGVVGIQGTASTLKDYASFKASRTGWVLLCNSITISSSLTTSLLSLLSYRCCSLELSSLRPRHETSISKSISWETDLWYFPMWNAPQGNKIIDEGKFSQLISRKRMM